MNKTVFETKVRYAKIKYLFWNNQETRGPERPKVAFWNKQWTRWPERPKVAHLGYKGTDLFCAAKDIIRTNVLTISHEDWTINVIFRVLTRFYCRHIRINSPPPCSQVDQPTGTIFLQIKDIIGMNLLTKFHEDRAKNVASRMLKRFYDSYLRKNVPWRPCFSSNRNSSEISLVQIIWPNFM